MSEASLLATLERLFAGPRDSPLTLAAFIEGLETRSYAFIVAALVLPNCVPTGIPLLSTVTGIPMVLVVAQAYLGRTSPRLPDSIGRRALPRGRLQDLVRRVRPRIEWLEARLPSTLTRSRSSTKSSRRRHRKSTGRRR